MPKTDAACLAAVILIILTVNVLRFCFLESAPLGFYHDEMSSALNANCLATKGVDIQGYRLPLFGHTNLGSPSPPTYMYPAAVWLKIFGVSISSIRGFNAFGYEFMLAGIFLLGRLLGGNLCGWLTLLAAGISPWGWMFSRLALESTFSVTYLVWGIYFFLIAGRHRMLNMVLSSLFIAAAMYSYPPTRLHAPLVVIFMCFYLITNNQFSLKAFLVFAVVLIFLCSPMIANIVYKGDLTSRFNALSIANPGYLHSIGKTACFHDLCWIFINNYLAHFSAHFLFFKGDSNLRHSTQYFGQLSWLDMLGILTAIVLLITGLMKRKLPSSTPVFLLLGALSGIIPSALTFEGIPHALRSFGAVPFVSLLTGYALARGYKQWPAVLPLGTITAIIFTGLFLRTYFFIYPNDSFIYFEPAPWLDAKDCKTNQDWVDFALKYSDEENIVRYYLLQYKGISLCSPFFPNND